VKWGKENFPSVEVNTDEEPLLFKAQLFALTGVQPERQKVLCKGIALKDEEWNLPLKNVNEKTKIKFAISDKNFLCTPFRAPLCY
jgi:hypothetical protein